MLKVLDFFIQAAPLILSSMIGAFITIKVFRRGMQANTAREQLDAVYARAFRLIEPVLYHKISRAQCNKIIADLEGIARNGGVRTNPELLHLISYYHQAPNGDLQDYPKYRYSLLVYQNCYLDIWFRICAHIEHTYDLLLRKAFFPIRNVRYRLDFKQHPNKFIWLLHFIRVDWPSILLCAIVGFFIGCMIAIILKISVT